MKVRKLSITNKLIIGVIFLLLVSDVVLGAVTYAKAHDILIDQIKRTIESVSATAAEGLNGSIIVAVQPGDEETRDYLSISNKLTKYMERADVEFVYTIRPNGKGGIEYAIDAQLDDPALIGDEFEDDEAQPVWSGKTVSSSEPYTDAWGTHVSIQPDLFRRQGCCRCRRGCQHGMGRQAGDGALETDYFRGRGCCRSGHYHTLCPHHHVKAQVCIVE